MNPESFNLRFGMAIMLVAVLFISAAMPVHANADYEGKVKPLLKQKCYACHGGLKQKAGLRLDTVQLMLKGGKSGPAVDAQHASASLMLSRVTETDEHKRMPQEAEALSVEQIALLKSWIEAGAPAPRNEIAETDSKQHWSFQSVQRPALPKGATSSGNPMDAFVNEALTREGLAPLPEASPSTLLRRVHIDLIGLPPTRDELRSFLSDKAPDAYERAVDRLLNDPRHGERWARHWMDVWRYSDWYGRRSANDVWNSAPQIWRWRDWIVRSLNADKGYDRMVSEMLAADEIAPLDDDAAVATGFLIRNWYGLNPNLWMRDNVEHTGKAFLGLTFNCAHCHDHKYDPITHEDYFRFRAFFEPLGVRQDRVAGEADPGPFQEYQYVTLRKPNRLGSIRVFDKQADAKTWFYTGGDERNRVESRVPLTPGMPAFLSEASMSIQPVPLPKDSVRPGLRPSIQETELTSRMTALTRAEEDLLSLASSPQSDETALNKARATLLAARAELASSIARLAADQSKYGEDSPAQKLALARRAGQAERDAVVANADAARASAVQKLTLAEALPNTDEKAREAAITAAKKSLTDAKAALDKAEAARQNPKTPESYTAMTVIYPEQSTGRRKALAEWITRRTNPLTARVAVNHIWMRHFQTPLVSSVFDFGRNGTKPTHPALLDWLSAELMENDWSMRHLHRLIVTSAAYRRASHAEAALCEANLKHDSDNKFLWRMNPARMEAEVVRDSVLHLAGALNGIMGGQELENTEAETSTRRSLYFSCHPETGGRSAMAATFDAPEPTDCYRRTSSVLPQQALVLTNSRLVHDHSAAMTARIASPDNALDIFIQAVFEQLLSRLPTAGEGVACHEFLKGDSRESLVRVLLNHNDFITVR